MKVRLTPIFESDEERDRPRRLRIQEVTGHAIYVRLPKSRGGGEVMLVIDDLDHERCAGFRHMPPTPVTDLLTGNTFVVESADCGLGCKCAAVFSKKWPR